MASFEASNFIKAYSGTDKFITLLYSNGNRFRTINVCQHKKVYVTDNTLTIVQEGGKQISLNFANSTEVNNAKSNFQSAIDDLVDNCLTDTQILPPGTFTIQSKTYQQYKTLQNTSALDVLQWYDVSDVDNDLGFGALVYRVLAKKEDDNQPVGMIGSTNVAVSFDCTTDKVIFYHDGVNRVFLTNGSSYTPTNTVTDLVATNQSSVICDNVSNIYANKSNINLTDSSNIEAINCSLSDVTNCTKCRFENLIFVPNIDSFENVYINDSNTIGKEGNESVVTVAPITLTIKAYKNTIYQTIDGGDLGGNLTFKLQNEIEPANATFKIKLTNLSTKTVTIKDNLNDTTLYTATNKDNDTILHFKWDVVNTTFVLVEDVAKQINRVTLTVNSNGQTSFPNVLVPAPYNPDSLTTYVNGQRADDFQISGSISLIWQDTEFTLDTDDEVIVEYY